MWTSLVRQENRDGVMVIVDTITQTYICLIVADFWGTNEIHVGHAYCKAQLTEMGLDYDELTLDDPLETYKGNAIYFLEA